MPAEGLFPNLKLGSSQSDTESQFKSEYKCNNLIYKK